MICTLKSLTKQPPSSHFPIHSNTQQHNTRGGDCHTAFLPHRECVCYDRCPRCCVEFELDVNFDKVNQTRPDTERDLALTVTSRDLVRCCFHYKLYIHTALRLVSLLYSHITSFRPTRYPTTCSSPQPTSSTKKNKTNHTTRVSPSSNSAPANTSNSKPSPVWVSPKNMPNGVQWQWPRIASGQSLQSTRRRAIC